MESTYEYTSAKYGDPQSLKNTTVISTHWQCDSHTKKVLCCLKHPWDQIHSLIKPLSHKRNPWNRHSMQFPSSQRICTIFRNRLTNYHKSGIQCFSVLSQSLFPAPTLDPSFHPAKRAQKNTNICCSLRRLDCPQSPRESPTTRSTARGQNSSEIAL